MSGLAEMRFEIWFAGLRQLMPNVSREIGLRCWRDGYSPIAALHAINNGVYRE